MGNYVKIILDKLFSLWSLVRPIIDEPKKTFSSQTMFLQAVTLQIHVNVNTETVCSIYCERSTVYYDE